MNTQPVFQHDDDQPDFKKLLEKAKENPDSVRMSEMLSSAETHIREVASSYTDKTLEEYVRDQGNIVDPRQEAHAYLFVSEPKIKEIWLLELTEKQMLMMYELQQKFGDRLVLEALFSDVLIAPHKMLVQKYRQLRAGSDKNGAVQFSIYWSDNQLKNNDVEVREEYGVGLFRVPVYHAPTMQAIVARG